jgi:hypothetical protein
VITFTRLGAHGRLGNTKNKEEIKEILLKNGYVIAFENVKHENFEFED